MLARTILVGTLANLLLAATALAAPPARRLGPAVSARPRRAWPAPRCRNPRMSGGRGQPPAGRCAEHPDRPARRRGLRPAEHLRRRDPHADADADADAGICYNTFHTTSICSPTRAALLTGRNHHRVGTRHHRRARRRLRRLHRRHPQDLRHHRRGAAPLRLQDRGVRQVAQHARRPDHGDGAVRPLADRPRLRLLLRLPRRRDVAVGAAAVREPQPDRAAARREIPPDRRHGRQGARLAASRHQAFAPDKPFFMYWAPGAAHGPHHIFKEWADKYKGKFDDGWDAYRERVFARQKELGWIPADTKLTPRAETMAVVGQHPRSGAAVPAAADGGLRRLRRAHRRPGRQG